MKIKVSRNNGSAILIVLLVLMVMSTYIAGNSRTLVQLKKEIDLIEKQQLKKYQKSPVQRLENKNPK